MGKVPRISVLPLFALLTSCATLQLGLLPDDRELVPGDRGLFPAGGQGLEQERSEEGQRRALQELFRRLGGRLALRPWLDLARSVFEAEKYNDARGEYLRFLDLFPHDPLADEAHYFLGLSYFKEMQDVDRDQSFTRKALEHFEAVLQKPDSHYGAESRTRAALCRRRLAEKELYVGNFYFKRGRYAAALGRFEAILTDYPGIGLDDQALFSKAESLWRLKRQEEARAAFRQLVRDYPGLPFTKEAARRLGVPLPEAPARIAVVGPSESQGLRDGAKR